MTRRKLNRKPRLVLTLLVFLMSWFYSPLFYQAQVSAETVQATPTPQQGKPLIVYFTLTGHNKIISEELQKQLNAPVAELKFRTLGYLGFYRQRV